jgi:pimeloyl-ACP methyl ester carboxylesterase
MPIPRYHTVAAGAIAATVAIAGPVMAEPNHHHRHRAGGCSVVSVPVKTASGASATVRGDLCTPARSANGALQILMGGVTYDSHYWTLPPTLGQPSYVAAQQAKGYATLTLDRLGSGKSSRPAADDVNYDVDVSAVHDTVTAVHNGLGGSSFSRVFLVGHSFGSGVMLGEASRYNDVTAVVLSGFAHAAGPKATELPGALVSAKTDPITAPGNPPDGYMTTAVGKRSYFFYDTADASAMTIAADEATKSTVTNGELTTLGSPYDATLAAGVKVPTLLAVGGKDALSCGGQPNISCTSVDELLTYEKGVFTGTGQLDGYILPGAGHAINLARNATDWDTKAADWMSGVKG